MFQPAVLNCGLQQFQFNNPRMFHSAVQIHEIHVFIISHKYICVSLLLSFIIDHFVSALSCFCFVLFFLKDNNKKCFNNNSAISAFL